MSPPWIQVRGVVVRGHGVASGVSGDPRYPRGTLHLQVPRFERQGLDLSAFHRATINVSIHPKKIVPRRPLTTLRGVSWHREVPPEDFSFFTCRLARGEVAPFVNGLVYYPHPETKPEHFQDPSTVEVLAPFLPGIDYGDELVLEFKSGELDVT